MGHDITANRPDIDENKLREQLGIDDNDEEWGNRYDEYRGKTEIASNHRSAGNPLNQVLYLALGVMDEAYGGCSGNGEELDISLEQLQNAQKILESKNFSEMTRERNMSDDIVDMLGSMRFEVQTNGFSNDISQEKTFIKKCIVFLETENLKTIKISFG